MPAIRVLRKRRGTELLFYPKHLIPKADKELFLRLVDPNPQIRYKASNVIWHIGKIREAVEFLRKIDFSRIPLNYFDAGDRRMSSYFMKLIKEAISKKNYFMHRGVPVYIIERLEDKLHVKGTMEFCRALIPEEVKGRNKEETQIFREIVAEHELTHFFTLNQDFAYIMELRYAFEKGKLNEWLKYASTYFRYPNLRLNPIVKYYPEIAEKITVWK